MRANLILFSLLVAASAAVSLTDRTSSPRAPEPYERLLDAAAKQDPLDELAAPSEAMLARNLFGSDVSPAVAMRRATRRAKTLEKKTKKKDPPVAETQWNFEGPVSIGGRVLDIAIDPRDPEAKTIFIATASGGVWKSTDSGTTFAPAWPEDLTQNIGALEVTPSGRLIAGTGEAGPGGGSLTYGGNGVYASDDGGETWERLGLEGSNRIGRIAIDPNNEDRIYVAAMGPLYKAGGQRGLYVTEDGGETWKRILEGENATTGAADIAIDPFNTNRLLASTWQLLREPDKRSYGGLGSGLWLSEDRGATWKRVGLGFFGPNPELGRIGVAFSPGTQGVAYANGTGPSGVSTGLYKTTDGGATWLPLPDTDHHGQSGSYVYNWWFGRIWVDPRNANHVFVAGVGLMRSTDGGNSFSFSGGVHADQHAMEWDTRIPNRVYLGNDGGVYRSDNNGASGSWRFATYQPFSQLYTMDVDESNPECVVAGLQDNGSNRSWRTNAQRADCATDGRWDEYLGGDGQRTLINPVNRNILYACYQYGECGVSKNGGDSISMFTNDVVSSRKNWLTPIEFAPENPSKVFTGGEIMSRSDNDGGDFSIISPELSNGPGRETNPLFKNFGTLTTIAPAPAATEETRTIYAGTDDGNLWYTHSGGGLTGWTKASDSDLPKAWVTRVEVDKSAPQRAFASFSGFRSGDDDAYVVMTTDGGRTWSDLTADLPHAPVNDINLLGDRLFAATDVGVFMRTLTAPKKPKKHTWMKVGENLPLTPIFEFRHHAPSNTLFVATFGRGIYSIDLAQLLEE